MTHYEGHDLVRECLAINRPGRYQILAAINAVHTDAPTAPDTDWSQVVALYDQLTRLDPSPIVALNRAVAVAELDGPAVALALIDRLPLTDYHPWHATRADLLRKPAEAPRQNRHTPPRSPPPKTPPSGPTSAGNAASWSERPSGPGQPSHNPTSRGNSCRGSARPGRPDCVSQGPARCRQPLDLPDRSPARPCAQPPHLGVTSRSDLIAADQAF